MNRTDIVAKINKILGTKLKLSKISKSDLDGLYSAISKRASGSVLGSLGQSILDKPLSEMLKGRTGKRPLGEMTLKDILGVVGKSVEGKGPLGLGLLPRILGNTKKGG